MKYNIPLVAKKKTDVLIVGSGVVGWSIAHQLLKKGIRSTLVDKGDLGAGCSYGNAGWLTPCFAMPLPQPGMLIKSMKWLLDPESPLHIQPRLSMNLAKWMWIFLRSMNQDQTRNAVQFLTGISTFSLKEYEELGKKYPDLVQFEKKGLLMATATKDGEKAAVDEMNFVAEFGIPGKFLKADEMRALEPALVGNLRSGVYFPEEAHAEPMGIVKALAKECLEQGCEFLPQHEVFDFEVQGDQIQAVLTTQGKIQADRIIMAAGSWSPALAKLLDMPIPILGGKGYSMIVKDFNPKPKIPLMLIEKKIAVTPRQDSIRLAGTLELVDQDFGISPRRLRSIWRGAREFMNVPEQLEVQEIWRGLRPCTPTGIPWIGPSEKWSNLTLCVGHQMLGLQSAPGSGRLVAEMINGEKTFLPLYQPFRSE